MQLLLQRGRGDVCETFISKEGATRSCLPFAHLNNSKCLVWTSSVPGSFYGTALRQLGPCKYDPASKDATWVRPIHPKPWSLRSRRASILFKSVLRCAISVVRCRTKQDRLNRKEKEEPAPWNRGKLQTERPQRSYQKCIRCTS